VKEGSALKTRIGRHFSFEAAHQLFGEQYGKCQNLHGHRYELTIEIEGEIDDSGWICDFAELDREVTREVLEKFDHQNLNSFFKVPTVEHIAHSVFATLDKSLSGKSYRLARVLLYETSDSYADVTR
jgi:6-pyruvoyltetrahydropterin/6-carboxytetrahydropterin synthase